MLNCTLPLGSFFVSLFDDKLLIDRVFILLTGFRLFLVRLEHLLAIGLLFNIFVLLLRVKY